MQNSYYIYALILFGSLLLLMIIFIIAGFIYAQRQRMLKHRMELEEAERRRERELLLTRIEVQEQALQFVSLEVHDNIGQVLSMVRMLMTNALATPVTREEMEHMIRESTVLLGNTINDLRNLSHTLSGKMVEEIGLVASITKELTYIRSLFRLHCSFSHPDEDTMPQLSAEQTLLLFRITQEAVQNTVKHARATRLDITLSSGQELQLSISDDGIGLNGHSTEAVKGMGLIDIRERAKLLGGSLDVRSGQGKGCTIALTMKL